MQMRLMLVDDHLLFLEGLQYLLEIYGAQVLGKACNGYDALLKARILKPDIILMDIRMPQCGGVEALKIIKAEMPEIKIIMLTTSEEEEDLFNALKFGASGYLLKNTDGKKLLELLYDIDNNEVTLSPSMALKILKEFPRIRSNDNLTRNSKTKDDFENRLTDRHMEILELVAKGKTYKEVGNQVCLTERTVKYHMGRILELLQLDNRTQLITYVIQKGLLDESDCSG